MVHTGLLRLSKVSKTNGVRNFSISGFLYHLYASTHVEGKVKSLPFQASCKISYTSHVIVMN